MENINKASEYFFILVNKKADDNDNDKTVFVM